MPKKMGDDKISIRLDLEGEEFEEFNFLANYYGLSIAKELVSFLIKQAYRNAIHMDNSEIKKMWESLENLKARMEALEKE